VNGTQSVSDFATKFDLAIGAAKKAGYNNRALLHETGVSHDTWYKWKAGKGEPSDEHFTRLVRTFHRILQVEPEAWNGELRAFESAIGRTVPDQTTGALPPATVQFRSRDPQPTLLLEQLSGYWAAFYCSTSRTDEVVVSRDLVEVAAKHRAGYIACRVTDSYFQYEGFCFSYGGSLVQWTLEKRELYNEVLTYMTTRPDRTPPVLYGVMICTSGGVDTSVQLPSCARVVFVKLGSNRDLQERWQQGDEVTRRILQQSVAKYVALPALPSWLRNGISNVLEPTAVPSALRVDAGGTPAPPLVAALAASILAEVTRIR
jgi:hypothetical protein